MPIAREPLLNPVAIADLALLIRGVAGALPPQSSCPAPSADVGTEKFGRIA